jgi:ankyrin repeat protein
MTRRTFAGLLLLLLVTCRLYGSSIHEMVENGDVQGLQKLLDEAPSLINSRGPGGYTPLYWAIHGERQQVIDVLLSQGANPNVGGSQDGQTPFGMAVGRGNRELVQKLIEAH